MSKRQRDDAGGGPPPELDGAMLRDAQHKAMSVALAKYKLTIAELEAQVAAGKSQRSALTDVVSVLGRQLAAVRPGGRRGSPRSPRQRARSRAPPSHLPALSPTSLSAALE